MVEFAAPDKGTPLTIDQAMSLALAAAELGGPFVSPNPQVGCVVLNPDNKFLAYGFHPRVGERHAEIDALEKLSEAEIKGAHFVVTLEPCAHSGRTPSCAKKLAELPIAKVTFAQLDPFPLVAGQGRDILRNAGKDVALFSERYPQCDAHWQARISASCEIFLKNQTRKQPWIAIKAAISLDGAMALASGESQWITGAEARAKGHYLRAIHDVTAVGVGTILYDNPQLNIRDAGIEKNNRVLVLDPRGRGLMDSSGRLNKSLNILSHENEQEVIWAVNSSAYESMKARGLNLTGTERLKIVAVESESTDFVTEVTQQLFDHHQVCSLLFEGGPNTHSYLAKHELIDRVHLFQAPIFLGGAAKSLFSEVKIPTMKDRFLLQHCRRQSLGQDQYITGLLRHSL